MHLSSYKQYPRSVVLFAVLAPPLLCSCIPLITHTKTEKVELPRPMILPTAATDMQAAANAQPISWTRPRDVRENPSASSHSVVEPRGWFIGEGYKWTLYSQNDADVWVDDALFESVKKAGYNIKRVDSVAAANTPVVIMVELIELSCGFNATSHGIMSLNSEKIAIRIHIIKSTQVLSDSTYEATSFEGKSIGFWEELKLDTLRCNDPDDVAMLSQKTLETLLAKAVPSLLTILAATLPAIVTAPASHQPVQ